MRKKNALPIGYSDVTSVIETGYYVDKTKYAQELIEKSNPIFIARPRRFGKSLFIETLATICRGEKAVFKDYHIGKNGYAWKKYPVIGLDFSGVSNNTSEELSADIKRLLKEIAFSYSVKIEGGTVKDTLRSLVLQLIHLHHTSAKKESIQSTYEPEIVVLIDEYDAPIVNLVKGSSLEQSNIRVLKDFFMTLKSLNKYFQLVFVTGVSKFNLSDVFSGANHLDDITIDASADAMFGYTQQEIIDTFSKNLEDIALEWRKDSNKEITKEMVIKKMAHYYNGYKFHKHGTSVYNPWSILKFLKSGTLSNYWYSSGNPELLLTQMKQDPSRFELLKNRHTKAFEHELMYTGSRSQISLKSLMFQTGYLTIDSYDKTTDLYTLKFPNIEIEESFEKSLQDSFEKDIKDHFLQERNNMRAALSNKDIKAFINNVNVAFYTIPYYLDTKREGQYHSNLHMLLQGLGFLAGNIGYVYSEPPTSSGRPDIVLEIENVLYIIEIKYKSTGTAALQQIKENHYYEPYTFRKKEIVLLGINFNEATRTIDSWDHEVYNQHLKS